MACRSMVIGVLLSRHDACEKVVESTLDVKLVDAMAKSWQLFVSQG